MFSRFILLVAVSFLIASCSDPKPVDPKKEAIPFAIPGATEEVKQKHEDGTHKLSVFYKEGTQEKVAEVQFHPNGQPYINKRFERDTLNGESWSYYADGKPWSLNTFKNGRYDGIYRTWHDNGQLNIDGHYKDGVEDGEWFTYYPTGTLNTRGIYRNGKKSGVWSSYNLQGTLIREEDFTTADVH